MTPSTVGWLSAVVGVLAAVAAGGPGILTAISHRESDNGLSFGILAVGITMWNVTAVSQLLAQETIVQAYFFLLSLVGASVAALGWFLFASTASSTPEILSQRAVYSFVALAVGLNVGLVVTIPMHNLYWSGLLDSPSLFGTAFIVAGTSYWLHTFLVAGLFLTGGWLFAKSNGSQQDRSHGLAYAVCGITVTVTILMSNSMTPGTGILAPILASGLVCIGVVQSYRS